MTSASSSIATSHLSPDSSPVFFLIPSPLDLPIISLPTPKPPPSSSKPCGRGSRGHEHYDRIPPRIGGHSSQPGSQCHGLDWHLRNYRAQWPWWPACQFQKVRIPHRSTGYILEEVMEEVWSRGVKMQGAETLGEGESRGFFLCRLSIPPRVVVGIKKYLWNFFSSRGDADVLSRQRASRACEVRSLCSRDLVLGKPRLLRCLGPSLSRCARIYSPPPQTHQLTIFFRQ